MQAGFLAEENGHVRGEMKVSMIRQCTKICKCKRNFDGIIESNCGRTESIEIVLCVKQMKSRNKRTGRIKKVIMRMP